MPIRPFLNDEQFDQETIRIPGVAFAQVCVALRAGDCDDDVKPRRVILLVQWRAGVTLGRSGALDVALAVQVGQLCLGRLPSQSRAPPGPGPRSTGHQRVGAFRKPRKSLPSA